MTDKRKRDDSGDIVVPSSLRAQLAGPKQSPEREKTIRVEEALADGTHTVKAAGKVIRSAPWPYRFPGPPTVLFPRR